MTTSTSAIWHFSQNHIQNILGKVDDDTTKEGHKALRTLPGIVAFEGETDLHNAKTQQNGTNNLQVTHTYTQVVMSTHSTHLSEVSDIEKVNVMKKVDEQTSLVMKPTNGLDQFGADVLEYKGICCSIYLENYV